MHRILLYVLVVALLYSAWSARRGPVLAEETRASGAAPAEDGLTSLADGRPVMRNLPTWSAQAERLDARVRSETDGFTQFDLQPDQSPAPEVVLAEAERWMESNFPEGGGTQDGGSALETEPGAPTPRELQDRLGAHSALREQLVKSEARSSEVAAGEDKRQDDSPVYFASLARIETLNGDLPAWCGLLDLALLPAGRRPDFSHPDARGDTAWISDDQGKLLARVETLDGLGFELDPNWPWLARQRRLFWTEGGISGMPVRQYRLLLQGGDAGSMWSGRLLLIHTPPGWNPTHR
ncbi:MAG TPA: hypothetical protein VK843_11525 [Planctomycetota bacterium]|nr:hypothetical protein [Planctomycetota bacterium]